MGSCNIKENEKPLFISFTPQTSIFSSNNTVITSEFIHSFNPSKTKSNSSHLIMNNFLRNDTHHTSSSVNSSDTFTSEDSYCSFDSEILEYFRKDKHNTKNEPSAMYYKVKSKNSSDENKFVMYNLFNNQRGDKVSFNRIPSLPLEHIKQPMSTAAESPKMFMRKDAMKDTHMISNAAPVNCPKKILSLTSFSEESSYRTLSSKNKTLNDRHLLFKLLSSISFLNDISKENAYEIIEGMQYVHIEPNTMIMRMNSIGNHIFFIKKGSVKYCPLNFPDKVYDEKKAPFVLGERILLNDKIRQWDVYSTNHIYAYVLKHKSTINFIKSTIAIDKISNRSMLNKAEVLCLLTEEQKDRLSRMMYKENFKEKETIINHYDRPSFIYILVSGSAVDTSENKELITPGKIFSYNNLIYNRYSAINVKCNKPSVCLSFSYDVLKEVFNDENYHIKMRNLFIKYKLSHDEYFGDISPLIDDAILNNFAVKFYTRNDTVISKGNVINDFLYVILEGDLYEENEPRMKFKENLKQNVLYSKEVFTGKEIYLKSSIKASCDCYIAKIKKKTMLFYIGKSFSEAKCVFRRKKALTSTKAFNGNFFNSNSKIIDALCDCIEEKVFANVNDVIYESNSIADKIFIVVEGEVKIVSKEENNNYEIKNQFHMFGIHSITSMLHKNFVNVDAIKVKYNETAYANKPQTKIYAISRSNLIEQLKENEQLMYYVIRRLFYLENTFELQKLFFRKYINVDINTKGKIYFVRRTLFDEQVAFLRIYKKTYFSNDEIFNDFPKVTKTLKSIDNNFISKIIALSFNTQYIFYLYPYIHGIPLSHLIYNNASFHLNYQLCKFISIQLFFAVKALHAGMLMHRVINPNNIIVDSNGYLKLTHLVSCTVVPLSKSATLKEGDIRFMAPEMLYGNNEYGFAVDYWSIGVIMFLLVAQKFPFNIEIDAKDKRKDIVNSIINDDLIFPSNVLNEDFKDLVGKLLEKSEAQRIKSFDCIIDHPFYKNSYYSSIETMMMEAPKELKGHKARMNPYKNEKYITFEEMNNEIYREDANKRHKRK